MSSSLIAIGAIKAISLSQVGGAKSQEEAPTLQTGVLTEKQKHHSKLYKEYRSDKKIPEQAAETNFDFGMTWGTGLPSGQPGVTPPTFSERITNLSCDADAIVAGEVTSKSSQLTEDQDFIFTDYELKVEEVIKNNASDQITPKAEITVTGPGGKIQINNRIVEAIDLSLPPLIVGERYLLFLKSTSIAGGYKAVNKESCFHLTGDSVETIPVPNRRLNDPNRPRPQNVGQSPTLLMQIREAIASGCTDEKKGGAQ
jgi:hypothetical protein